MNNNTLTPGRVSRSSSFNSNGSKSNINADKRSRSKTKLDVTISSRKNSVSSANEKFGSEADAKFKKSNLSVQLKTNKQHLTDAEKLKDKNKTEKEKRNVVSRSSSVNRGTIVRRNSNSQPVIQNKGNERTKSNKISRTYISSESIASSVSVNNESSLSKNIKVTNENTLSGKSGDPKRQGRKNSSKTIETEKPRISRNSSFNSASHGPQVTPKVVIQDSKKPKSKTSFLKRLFNISSSNDNTNKLEIASKENDQAGSICRSETKILVSKDPTCFSSSENNVVVVNVPGQWSSENQSERNSLHYDKINDNVNQKTSSRNSISRPIQQNCNRKPELHYNSTVDKNASRLHDNDGVCSFKIIDNHRQSLPSINAAPIVKNSCNQNFDEFEHQVSCVEPTASKSQIFGSFDDTKIIDNLNNNSNSNKSFYRDISRYSSHNVLLQESTRETIYEYPSCDAVSTCPKSTIKCFQSRLCIGQKVQSSLSLNDPSLYGLSLPNLHKVNSLRQIKYSSRGASMFIPLDDDDFDYEVEYCMDFFGDDKGKL